MKKLFFALPLAALLFQTTCSNEFDVTAPWKEVPIAYAILSPKDTAQYIRVEKAFLDPETNSLVIAQIPDSIYFPEGAISVYLERVSNGQQILLQRVDGNLDGYVRKDGVFATHPNWLYKTKEQLFEAEHYRLRITRNDGRPPITAETRIPKEFSIRQPADATPSLITFKRDVSPSIEWRTEDAGIYSSVYFSIQFRIRYRENALNGSLIKRDTLYWTPAPNVERTDTKIGSEYVGEFVVSTESFYNFLVQNIPAANDRFRVFEGIDITLEGGGAEIERYLQTAAANAGITGAEVVSTYTNLSEGYGIFTAKNRALRNNVKVTHETVLDMNIQSPEKDLNFQ